MAGKANAIVGAIVALALVAAVGVMAFQRFGSSGASDLRALVHDSDGAVHELALARDFEVTIQTSLGTNVVVVRDGSVFVREADCDNQDCVHQGAIDAPGRQIICLPHKLWIEVVADGDAGGELDVQAAASGESQDAGDFDAVAR